MQVGNPPTAMCEARDGMGCIRIDGNDGPDGPRDEDKVLKLEQEISRLDDEREKLQSEYDTRKERIKDIDQTLEGDIDDDLRDSLSKERWRHNEACTTLQVRIAAIEEAMATKRQEVDDILGIKHLGIATHPFPDNRFDFRILSSEVRGRVMEISIASTQTDPSLYEIYWTGMINKGKPSTATVFFCAPGEPNREAMEEHKIHLRIDLSEVGADVCYLEPGVEGSRHTELWGPPIWMR